MKFQIDFNRKLQLLFESFITFCDINICYAAFISIQPSFLFLSRTTNKKNPPRTNKHFRFQRLPVSLMPLAHGLRMYKKLFLMLIDHIQFQLHMNEDTNDRHWQFIRSKIQRQYQRPVHKSLLPVQRYHVDLHCQL